MVEEIAMTSRTRLFVLLISAPVIAFAIIGGFLGNALARGDDTYSRLRVFQDVVSLIMGNYVEEPNLERVMRGAMRGLAEGLDPDSAYLNPQEVRQVESGGAPPAGELGVQLTHQYYLRVVAARDDSPASKAGVRPGDLIRLIDTTPTRDMSVFEGERLLRGAPGSKVRLTIIRGSAVEPHVVDLVREAAPAAPQDVRGRMQGDGVGYIRVAGFGKRIGEQLRTQVAALTKSGASRLIVDVRNVAGGELVNGISAARLFVPSGTLAIREARTTGQEKILAARGDGDITLPLEVLMDTGTSGAAELFAAALSGNKRAELVGERTLGRTGTQELVKLPDGSGLWMTSSRYFTPGGAPLHVRGLEPDVVVDEPDVEFGAAAPPDQILQKAVERLALKKAA
jgi:carboxyl-terminal processing protease